VGHQRVDIPAAEYEERRHVFELCRWINSKLASMESCENFDELYFERKGQNVKKLLEEAVPLSRLGLHLCAPARDVYVTCFVGNQPFDAEIEIAGFSPRAFRVEVTTTETDESTLRRQALSRRGYVGLSGSIERRGRDIAWSAEMTEVSAEEERCTDLMFERLRDKVESGRYGKDTAILIYLTEYQRVGLESRANLVRRTQRYLRERGFSVQGVYYCYTLGHSVDEVASG
jgi:hypothetical protein